MWNHIISSSLYIYNKKNPENVHTKYKWIIPIKHVDDWPFKGTSYKGMIIEIKGECYMSTVISSNLFKINCVNNISIACTKHHQYKRWISAWWSLFIYLMCIHIFRLCPGVGWGGVGGGWGLGVGVGDGGQYPFELYHIIWCGFQIVCSVIDVRTWWLLPDILR